MTPEENAHVEALREESIEITVLTEQVAIEKLRADENWEKLLRKEADLQNALKRAQLDIEQARKFGVERLAQDLLAVIDSMERGMEAIPADLPEGMHVFREGLDLTYKQLLAALSRSGITAFDPKGEAFNPQYHAALTMQESAEIAPNHVLAVIQKGYMLEGRLLRAASVIVSKAVAAT